mmetsp:Transcript_21774/g.44622  ORF Transcript_21774/g.44622 Transcript_21774/m.44622 type:complete len:81 (+) Transcript_21774:617-859(+)
MMKVDHPIWLPSDNTNWYRFQFGICEQLLMIDRITTISITEYQHFSKTYRIHTSCNNGLQSPERCYDSSIGFLRLSLSQY